jgi:lysylphosphatidylglycerol synthase-like protein
VSASDGQGQVSAAPQEELSRATPRWKKVAPYVVTLLIFALIFWRIPIGRVEAALENVPIVKFFCVFLPFSAVYWMIDSFCLTWVLRRFNAPLRLRDILPIRASMYLLALINTNLGQGGVAWYLHRKAGIPLLEVLSSILFIALMEVYQLFLFSTVGIVFYLPGSPGQSEIVGVMRVTYVAAWLLLVGLIVLFAQARRSDRIRAWIGTSRFGAGARTFFEARPRDYAIVIAIKAPSFLMSLVTQYLALSLYGINIPWLELMLFLPLVFLAAALPIGVAHLGTSQAAWLLFFSGRAPSAKILAYSLAAHFTFMFCNALIGLCFLRHAIRELTGLEALAPPEHNCA